MLATGDTRYGLIGVDIMIEIDNYKPDLVGVSCLFSNKAWDAHNVCRLVKLANPNIITVMGGAHPTALPEETLKDENVDYVIKGEGEQVFKGFISSLNFYGHHRGQAFGREDMRGALVLDSLPFPARHLLRNDIYMSGESPHSGLKQTPAATMTTSRGCPSRCTFCAIRSMWGDAFRTRSPENVLAEIEHLVETYHIKELHFEDDCFTANKKRAMAILQGIIDHKWNLSLNSPSGLAIFAMDEELIDKMYEAGYYSLSFAIESGDQRILKLMRKKVDHAKAHRLIQYARSLGMKTKAFYILGYPGETQDTVRETVLCAFDMEADWSLFFPATPLPGTEMMKTCQDNGYLVDPDMDYRYSFYKPNIQTPEFDPEYILRVKDIANEDVNFTHNINLREGKYERAIDDFEDVLKLYPDLEIAKIALVKMRFIALGYSEADRSIGRV